MIEVLLEPLKYPFLLRGLVATTIVGIVCAIIGTYVVLRGMAFFGDALAHAILPGIAVGYLLGSGTSNSLFWWGLVTAIASAIGIGFISHNTKIKEDTAIGIIFAGMLALGVALISTTRNYTIDLAHFLFGDVLGVQTIDLLRMGLFGCFILIIVFSLYKEFLVLSFDPILASTLRLPVRLLDYLLMILIAVAVVVALRTVGVALMVAALVTPAATAYLVTRRLPVMMMLAASIASISGFVGLYLSYYLSIASGAAIVLTYTVIFILTWSLGKFRQRFTN